MPAVCQRSRRFLLPYEVGAWPEGGLPEGGLPGGGLPEGGLPEGGFPEGGLPGGGLLGGGLPGGGLPKQVAASFFIIMMSDHNSSDLAPQRQEMYVENVTSGLVPQGQMASDYDNSGPVPPRQNVVPTAEKTDSSHQGLEFLFSPLIEEYYTPTHGQAEENNNEQARNASFQEDEFINPFCTRVQETGESSSFNSDNTDVHSFQPQSHDYRWTKEHHLEQVLGKSPTMPVQTRRQLAEILKCVCSRSRISWMSKKQNCTAMSSAEAEYVALSASCAQVMWMRTQLKDYSFNYTKIPLIPEYQLDGMFTKALPEDRFKYLVRRIGMICLTPADLEVLTNKTA
ncbi:hypothetical protein Tco_1135671 [Tanacetum coccineum]